MFGAFRPSSIASGGLLWKSPWRLSTTRKANLRKRLRRVDDVIAALAESGVQTRSLDRAAALPTEADMLARGEAIGCRDKWQSLCVDTHAIACIDKYTVFSPHARGYRQGVHKVPKWTKRENPRGF